MSRGGKRAGAGRKSGSLNKNKRTDLKSKVIHVRLTDDEQCYLLRRARAKGKTPSACIRDALNNWVSIKEVE